jgi:hypothetical protein
MNLEKQRRMCFNKTRYEDKRAAQTVLNHSMNKRGRHGRALSLRIYPCPNCIGWNMTSSELEE